MQFLRFIHLRQMPQRRHIIWPTSLFVPCCKWVMCHIAILDHHNQHRVQVQRLPTSQLNQRRICILIRLSKWKYRMMMTITSRTIVMWSRRVAKTEISIMLAIILRLSSINYLCVMRSCLKIYSFERSLRSVKSSCWVPIWKNNKKVRRHKRNTSTLKWCAKKHAHSSCWNFIISKKKTFAKKKRKTRKLFYDQPQIFTWSSPQLSPQISNKL